MAIDQNGGTKYLNFGEQNSGFIVTPSSGPSIVTSFQIRTANDAQDRDPASWQLFGTNQTILSTDNSNGSAESWTLIASGSFSGPTALPTARNTLGPVVSFSNAISYKSYRMVFPTVRNAGGANSMQINEFSFLGNAGGTPASLRLESSGTSEVLLSIAGDDAAGNLVTQFPAASTHSPTRLVIQAGTNALSLPLSDLSFTDDQGLCARFTCRPSICWQVKGWISGWPSAARPITATRHRPSPIFLSSRGSKD
jgi:hypothetical protein